MGLSTLEKSRNSFGKLAWITACVSLLVSFSHVRSFPSYNLGLSLIGLYASIQEDTEVLLKSLTICAIMGALSILADIAFCFLWAKEIIDGYNGVLKFCLVAFIANMFAKASLLYSAMIVAVAASTDESEENDIASPKSLPSIRSSISNGTPTRSFQSEVDDHRFDLPLSPHTPGIAGLISPGYDPRASYRSP